MHITVIVTGQACAIRRKGSRSTATPGSTASRQPAGIAPRAKGAISQRRTGHRAARAQQEPEYGRARGMSLRPLHNRISGLRRAFQRTRSDQDLLQLVSHPFRGAFLVSRRFRASNLERLSPAAIKMLRWRDHICCAAWRAAPNAVHRRAKDD